MKMLDEFSFANNSTPTAEVQEFIYTTMRKICDIQDELRDAIIDYEKGDESDAVRFGLKVAETEMRLKSLADILEIIHNNSVRLCAAKMARLAARAIDRETGNPKPVHRRRARSRGWALTSRIQPHKDSSDRQAILVLAVTARRDWRILKKEDNCNGTGNNDQSSALQHAHKL